VVGARSFPGNPYDGHTLGAALGQVEVLTGVKTGLAVVDRGYRGNKIAATKVLISGQRRGVTPTCGDAQASNQRSATCRRMAVCRGAR